VSRDLVSAALFFEVVKLVGTTGLFDPSHVFAPASGVASKLFPSKLIRPAGLVEAACFFGTPNLFRTQTSRRGDTNWSRGWGWERVAGGGTRGARVMVARTVAWVMVTGLGHRKTTVQERSG